MVRLVQDFATIFCVGVVSKVRAFVEKALPFGVDHEPEGVTVFLESIADGQVPELWSVVFPSDCVSATPVAVWHSSYV